MIKLTSAFVEGEFWVNPKYIMSVGRDADGDVYIVANGTMSYVEETVEEILFKMGVDTKGPNV